MDRPFRASDDAATRYPHTHRTLKIELSGDFVERRTFSKVESKGDSKHSSNVDKFTATVQFEADVVDTQRFKQFREKREEWVSWLAGDDLHAIWKQIASLQLDYVLFLTVNDLCKEAAENPVEGVGFNAQVLRLLDVGFVATQATGIRRLTEIQWKDPMKGVISLRALVEGINASRDLLTREIYVACGGLPYNFTPGKEAFFNELAVAGKAFSFAGSDTTGSHACHESERAHERFDKLSDTSPTVRSREDRISSNWFDRLDSKLKSCEDVCVFADKFVAHAANTTSRSRLSANQEGITLARLAEYHQALAEVAEFVGCRILQCSSGAALPTPQFDPVANLDKAWTGVRDFEKGEDKAGRLWERNWQSVKQWELEALRRFEQESV